MTFLRRLVQHSRQDLHKPDVWKAAIAEFIGTGFEVFLGCGAAVTAVSDTTNASDVTKAALGMGLAVTTMIWCKSHLTGGHINPAVTLGFFVTRKISLLSAVVFTVFQCLGAIAGAGLLYSVSVQGVRDGTFACNTLRDTNGHLIVEAGQAVLAEALVTFALVFTVFATCDDKRADMRGTGPLTIGLVTVVGHLAVIPLTGCSMNPARSLGPAVLRGDICWSEHWVFWVGPMIGGALGGLVHDLCYAEDADVRKFIRCATTLDYALEEAAENDSKQVL